MKMNSRSLNPNPKNPPISLSSHSFFASMSTSTSKDNNDGSASHASCLKKSSEVYCLKSKYIYSPTMLKYRIQCMKSDLFLHGFCPVGDVSKGEFDYLKELYGELARYCNSLSPQNYYEFHLNGEVKHKIPSQFLHFFIG
ncbi:hypothetical protein IFM89_004580 [Coptis chinensis]|uniref:Uncharacterized protein n=1 Tax=Coptis chinensis TaxID=261450 RepID=A0A835H1J0_9MAGN|nr:hypothetical protein IFM89_004580 [Coptis chinensis]